PCSRRGVGRVERQEVDRLYDSGVRDYYGSRSVGQPFAGSDLRKTNNGTEWPAARQNYFTRINYAFRDKYLFEFVGRYDGSYIFPVGKRLAFFAAGSAGWRTSDEPFFRDHVPLFDDLKLRVSWGKTGNDRIEPWQYLATYGFGSGYVFGVNQVVQSVFQTRIPNPNVTWEVAKQFDVGLEGRLLSNRLHLQVDRFTERRSNILAFRNASVPQTAAIPLPRENIGVVANRGYDGSITWQQQIATDVSF